MSPPSITYLEPVMLVAEGLVGHGQPPRIKLQRASRSVQVIGRPPVCGHDVVNPGPEEPQTRYEKLAARPAITDVYPGSHGE